jgi:hypothetical protein
VEPVVEGVYVGADSPDLRTWSSLNVVTSVMVAH